MCLCSCDDCYCKCVCVCVRVCLYSVVYKAIICWQNWDWSSVLHSSLFCFRRVCVLSISPVLSGRHSVLEWLLLYVAWPFWAGPFFFISPFFISSSDSDSVSSLSDLSSSTDDCWVRTGENHKDRKTADLKGWKLLSPVYLPGKKTCDIQKNIFTQLTDQLSNSTQKKA